MWNLSQRIRIPIETWGNLYFNTVRTHKKIDKNTINHVRNDTMDL